MGVDVVSYDNHSWEGPTGTWAEVADGSERDAWQHRDRTLLLVMPPRSGSLKMIVGWEGDRLIVASYGNYPGLGGMDQEAGRIDELLRRRNLLFQKEILTPGLHSNHNVNFFLRK
jgi:hypothetical protein